MRLSRFIVEQKEPILQEWEDFARIIEPPSFTVGKEALRDHANRMLDTIAIDLNTAQTPCPSNNKNPRALRHKAAEKLMLKSMWAKAYGPALDTVVNIIASRAG